MEYLPALSASLLTDPFYQSITTDFSAAPADRVRVLEHYFEYSFLEAQRTGRCIVAPREQDGAAAWLLPRSDAVNSAETQAKNAFLAEVLGPKGNLNYHRIIDFMSPRAAEHVPADAWYLTIVGVNPKAQGNGLGKALLRPTLDEMDSCRAVAYLETFSIRNRSFYERLGFRTVAEYLEPTTTASYALMRRDS